MSSPESSKEQLVTRMLASEAHINATSFNRMVLLTGEAPAEQAKADIENIARNTPDVRSIVNEIQVSGNSGMPGRTFVTEV